MAALDPRARLVASEILEIEVVRAAGRAAGTAAVAAARNQLAGIRLLPLNGEIRRRAGELTPVTLRSLDAIHLATALNLGERLETFCGYDARMTAAASQAGLRVIAPR